MNDTARGLVVGLRAEITHEVGEADTAIALGSGDVPVLGTPKLLALAEAATVAAVAPALADGQTTVGVAVRVEHSRPSPVGSALAIRAELTEIEGRKLTFAFIAYGSGRDGDGGDDALVLGAGMVRRVVVERDAFTARATG
jgi:predicted thioesterase